MEDMLERTRRTARMLTADHGNLIEVYCRSGPPQQCRADMVFADGSQIVVTAEENALGLKMTFGYCGAGPRLFHTFLNEAGFCISEDEVERIEAPCVLRHGHALDFTSRSTERDDLVTKAFVACELRQYAKARACYAKTTEIYPGDFLSWYNLGVVQCRLEDWQGALEAFQRVLDYGQHRTVATYCKAICLTKLGVAVELPPDFAGKAEPLGAEAMAHNLAAELENRGHKTSVHPKEHTCSIVVPADDGKYTVLFCDYGVGTIHIDVFKEDSAGNSRRLADSRADPNQTLRDQEILSLAEAVFPFQPAQMPIALANGSRAMDAESYIRATHAARAESEVRMFGPYGWVRRGNSLEESDRKRDAEFPDMHVTHIISMSAFAGWAGEPGQSGYNCVINGQPHTAVAFDVNRETAKCLKHWLHHGAVRFYASLQRYPTYPLLYLTIAARVGGTDDRWQALLGEAVGDFTEANFQEWAMVVRDKGKTTLHAFGPRQWELGTFEIQLTDRYLDALTDAIGEADAALRLIPRAKWDFQTAARQFWCDHPTPLILESIGEK